MSKADEDPERTYSYAYPSVGTYGIDGVTGPMYGLTKREYFAAMAMQGFATKGWEQNMAANWAVEYADALLAALQRKPE